MVRMMGWMNGDKLESKMALIRHPANVIVSGPSQSGKTWWIQKLISTPNLISPRPTRILYYYSQWQPLFTTMKGVEFYKGLPRELPEEGKPVLIILDDLLDLCAGNKDITNLFVRGTHHLNLTVVLVCQNLFEKNLRTISLNTHYFIIMRSPRARSQIAILASQMYPKQSRFVVSAYDDISSSQQGYTYLFLDLKPDTPEQLRVRTNVLGENNMPPFVYLP